MLVLNAPPLYLQVGAEEGLLLGVFVVVPHQQVEQDGRLSPQGRQLGDAALEHLAAEGLAQRHAALEQHGWELAGQCVSMLALRSRQRGGEQFDVIFHTSVGREGR